MDIKMIQQKIQQTKSEVKALLINLENETGVKIHEIKAFRQYSGSAFIGSGKSSVEASISVDSELKKPEDAEW